MIIDARRTNKLFRKPPTTILGSVDALSRLEIEGEDTHVFMAQEDVKDYFYRLSIDRGLGEYFCLPMVDGLLLKEYLGFLPDEFTKLSDQFAVPYILTSVFCQWGLLGLFIWRMKLIVTWLGSACLTFRNFEIGDQHQSWGEVREAVSVQL